MARTVYHPVVHSWWEERRGGGGGGGGGGGNCDCAKEQQGADLHLAALNVQAPEVQLMDPELGQDGAEGHAGDDLCLRRAHVLVPLALEAFAHELHNPSCRACVHEMDVLVRVAGRHQQPDVILSVVDHTVVLHNTTSVNAQSARQPR